MNLITHYTFQKPILTGIILMLIALGFRLIDIFVLRLDERLGEIILSKTLGFFLVLLFVWAIGRKLASIGFHRKRLSESLLIGMSITFLPLIPKQASLEGCYLHYGWWRAISSTHSWKKDYSAV